jgi:hypothetical protein
MKRCENGHFYEPAKHHLCPYCGVPGLGEIVSEVVSESAEAEGARNGRASAETSRAGEAPGAGAFAKTRRVVFDDLKCNPVVGWLVCIEGPDRGRDYRIRSERNFIGRGVEMDVAVQGDDTISRKNHAVISFNPEQATFKVMPGEARGMVYLNQDAVDTAREMSPFDVIRLGKSKLMFVPFCGDNFNWV